MIEKSTKDLLVKFLYNETSLSETMKIEELLNDNWELREYYATLEKAKKEFPIVQFDPPAETINKILRYSQSTALDLEAQV
ncbi:MAG: hypothetical protein AAF502_08015 [Bacteroidota bacterium]